MYPCPSIQQSRPPMAGLLRLLIHCIPTTARAAWPGVPLRPRPLCTGRRHFSRLEVWTAARYRHRIHSLFSLERLAALVVVSSVTKTLHHLFCPGAYFAAPQSTFALNPSPFLSQR
ncbi:hypothetical protein GE09DRAFT_418953 [Coniochaeta sp. 2T2.1]|nr:hypothetical protein GE09DRAFT_418953 [Coniochaeta sp. 2T2.1]